MRNKNYFNIVSALMDSSSSSWQKRIKAPEGFPWNGNIVKALSELNDIELPRELEAAVRYYPTQNDNNNTVDDYEDFKNESSQYIKDDDYVDNSNDDSDDELDLLLADEEDEEDNDGLDSFLSNDDDYNENSVQENEDNDDSNGGRRNIQDELNNILNSEDNEEKDSFDKLFDEDEDDGYLNLF